MSPEQKKQPRIREITFRIEEDLDVDQPEFLTAFLDFLKSKNYDPDQLVFSGFDARPFTEGMPLERKAGTFGMNLAGWKSTYEPAIAPNNPAHYAEKYVGKGVPAIALYDKNQLAEAYFHELDEPPETMALSEEEGHKLFYEGQPVGGWSNEGDPDHFDEPRYEELLDERAGFKEVDMGEPLASLPVDSPIIEGVVHIDYPEGSPADALLAIVYLERIPAKKTGHRNRAGF